MSRLHPAGLAPREPLRTPDVLAALLDLHGSVQLAATLAAAPARPSAPPRARAPIDEAWAARTRKRLAAIEEEATRALVPPFGGRVPDAAAIAAKLAAGTAPRDVARAIAKPLHERFAAAIDEALDAIDAARGAIGDTLRARGGALARLDALDAALRSGTSAGVRRLASRAAAACEPALIAAVTKAARAIPAERPTEAIARWLDADGPVGAYAAALRAVVEAVVGAERAVVEALLTEAAARGGA